MIVPRVYPWVSIYQLHSEEHYHNNQKQTAALLRQPWLEQKWHDALAIDKRIRNLATRPIYSNDLPALIKKGEAYANICNNIANSYDYVFFTAHLNIGGADRVTVNYVNAVRALEPAARILVVVTEPVSEIRRELLSEGVDIVALGYICREQSEDVTIALTLRLLIQTQPRVMHVIHSRLGLELIKHHAAMLRRYSRLYVTTFMFERTTDKSYVSHGLSYFPDIHQDVTLFTSDNQTFNREMHETYGIPSRKLRTHYQPVAAQPVIKRKPRKNHMTLLWAGRLDREKHPELVVEIIKKLQQRGKNVTIKVYGSSVLHPELNFAQLLQRVKGIEYGGSFTSFYDLPLKKCDAFLLTSEFEGLPNTVLEAMSASLPVIAPDVGSVREVVQHQRTGLVVPQYDDVDGYVAAIELLLQDYDLRSSLAQAAYELMRQRHSMQHFVADIQRMPRYLSGST